MNQHPVQLLEPVFRFLDTLIAEHGHVLYLVMVYVSLPLIAWIMSGGLRRKRPPHPTAATILPILVIRPSVQPSPLPLLIDKDPERGRWPSDDDDGNSSFAA